MSETNARSVADMGQHKSHDWRNLFTLVMQLCRVPAEFCVLWKFADENKAKNTKLDESATKQRNKKKSSVILLGKLASSDRM